MMVANVCVVLFCVLNQGNYGFVFVLLVLSCSIIAHT